MLNDERFIGAFEALGDDWQSTAENVLLLEEYVLYVAFILQNQQELTMPDLMFMKKHAVKNKNIRSFDASTLSLLTIATPTTSKLHFKVVKIISNEHSFASCCDGSTENAEIRWIEETYTNDISDLLLHVEEENDPDRNDDEESEEYVSDDDDSDDENAHI